jgi:hypothetical protein
VAACTATGQLDCNSGPRSAIYYHVSDLSPRGYWYLDYWWFYRFNDGYGFEDHEGDWEGVSVGIPMSDQHTFDFANFAQHRNVYSYLRDNLECDGTGGGSCGTASTPTGVRLNVYPANGTHASYAKRCTAIPWCTTTNGGPLDHEHHHGGEDEWGNNGDSTALHEFPLTAPSTVPAEWVNGPRNFTDWPGSWGNDVHVASPARPTGRFRTPWADVVCADGDSCPVQQKLAAARAKPPSSSKPNVGNCAGWFGGGVVAAACVPKTLRTSLERARLGKSGQFRLEVRRKGKGVSADSAPGLAQAMGNPLKPGDSLIVRGASDRAGELLVRVAVGRKIYTARFDTMGLTAKRGRAVLRVKRGTVTAAGRRAPQLVLQGANGGTAKPAALSP